MMVVIITFNLTCYFFDGRYIVYTIYYIQKTANWFYDYLYVPIILSGSPLHL